MILKTRIILLVAFCCFLSIVGKAQPENLLQNPSADEGAKGWQKVGNAVPVTADSRTKYFAISNGGHFAQDVNITDQMVGRFALLIARVASERINSDGAITGLPSLYGYMLKSGEKGTILSYLQGQKMLCSAKNENEWVTAWGVFKVPDDTGGIRIFLNQAERKGVPQNGSIAKFDDVGVFIFDTEDEAKNFAVNYRGN